MERDMDLVRKILIKVEEEVGVIGNVGLVIDGYDMETIAYHCSLLADGGYLSSYNALCGSDEVECFAIGHLTWNGHEFLVKIRDDTIWNKTKEVVVKKGLTMTIDVVKDIATSIISTMTQAAIKGLTQ